MGGPAGRAVDCAPPRTDGEIVLSRLAPEGTPFIEWYDTWPLTGRPVMLTLSGGRTARALAAMPNDTVLALALAGLDPIIGAA